jgi:CheY-like chemotaxis protein
MTRAWKMCPAEAVSAEDALRELQAAQDRGHDFRMVISDLHMPEMDGFELAQKLRETPGGSRTVILMLTSGDRHGDLEKSRRLGISHYLFKPVRRDELGSAIRAALRPETATQPVSTTADLPPLRETPRLRILLAEDNAVNQRVASRILEKAGHLVVIAGDGLEALACIEQQSFDLVLMDIQMPSMDGHEATQRIRSAEREKNRSKGPGESEEHIPIVAMTAHAMRGDRERCLQAGMDDYVSKPVRSEDLLRAVLRATQSQHPVNC